VVTAKFLGIYESPIWSHPTQSHCGSEHTECDPKHQDRQSLFPLFPEARELRRPRFSFFTSIHFVKEQRRFRKHESDVREDCSLWEPADTGFSFFTSIHFVKEQRRFRKHESDVREDCSLWRPIDTGMSLIKEIKELIRHLLAWLRSEEHHCGNRRPDDQLLAPHSPRVNNVWWENPGNFSEVGKPVIKGSETGVKIQSLARGKATLRPQKRPLTHHSPPG